MTYEWEWKPLRKVLTVFLVFLMIFIQVKNAEFKETYKDYIDGTRKVIAGSPTILVKYQYRLINGQIADSYYAVPDLGSTPEWKNIQLMQILFFSMLPWAVPRRLQH